MFSCLQVKVGSIKIYQEGNTERDKIRSTNNFVINLNMPKFYYFLIKKIIVIFLCKLYIFSVLKKTVKLS